jgi:hypothetical protein
MTRIGPFFSYGEAALSLRMRYALEVRAIVPLAKGTEVFGSYTSKLGFGSRANRRKALEEKGGFVCQCEICTLPDDLSDALDTKITDAMKAGRYINQMFNGTHSDYDGGVRCIETLMTTITEERIFNPNDLMMPILFFAFFHLRILLAEVGQVLVPVLERYWGTDKGIGEHPANTLRRYLEDPLTIPAWASGELYRATNLGREFYARLGQVASNIITSLKSLPS